MQHKEYWAERFEKLTDGQLNKGTEYYYNLQEQYRKAIASIEKDVAKWYTRYATENGITLTEAKRLLNGRELEEFRMDVKEYIAKGKSLEPRWAKQLEAASAKVHVSRLEALKVQMQQQAEMLYSYERDGIDELARSVYTDGYYHTAYEIQKGIGVGFDLMALDANRIDKLISKPWAADGKNFSERIWNNRAQLVSELENRLTQSIIRGQSPKKVIAELAERFNVNKSRAGALVMTESAFFAAASQRDAFNDLDVEKYEILATLDSRTSETCRIMDGKVIPMSDYKPGATAPPFHVRCYDKETEVYTNNGWKLFKDLTDADMVYTIDKDTLIPEWQKPLKIISYIHNGNLLHFVNDRTDLKVTPNHSLLVQNMDSSVKDRRYKLRTAESIGAKSKNRMLSGCKWIGETVETALLGGKEVDIETYLRFMAYWLADGSCTKDRTSYSIKIAQCNNDKMAAELSKLPFNVYKCKEALMIHNKELGAELSVYGKCADKFVPEFIKTLSPKLIKIFLEAYAATDGTTKKGKFWKGYQFADSVSFFTTSEKMAADLGELILKAGGRPSFSLQKHKGKEVTFKNGTYTLNYDLWVIFWNRQIHNWICYMDVTKEAYNDYVYCVEVEKHNTLLVRRNGKVVWCGNCRSTTVPFFDDEFSTLDKRAARGEDGKYYTVPASMKYKDWEEAFIKGGSKANLKEIALKDLLKGDIISGEKERLPRSNTKGDYGVKWEYIQSEDYSNKFKSLSANPKTQSAIETRAKWALDNRDGVNTEEIYAIDLSSGKEVGRVTNQHFANAVHRTPEFIKALQKADKEGKKLLLLHNHPKGYPPSISDLNSLLENKNAVGITVGHDGSVYYYTKPNGKIPERDWVVAIGRFKGYSEVTAQEKALELLSAKYDFTVKKL